MIEVATTLKSLASNQDVFSIEGLTMRAHTGRSVVKVCENAKTYYLKRYRLAPSQLFKRHVSRGFHEMRMIDWLNANGFAGPRIVARGSSAFFSVTTRMYFLMEEVAGEVPLEQAWWRFPNDEQNILNDLALFAARLHDSGFIHTDFSERHIFTGRGDAGWTFRLIDLERARVGVKNDRLAAADLKTLAASIANEELRGRIQTDFLDDYISRRKTISKDTDMRSLFARATPTKRF